jgi:uncharacterized protein (DUF362 family)
MSEVQVLLTKPSRVVDDYRKIIRSYRRVLPKKQPVILKLNLSWSRFYPACSSPPWQLEGVIRGLLDLGFSARDIIPVENRTVVTNVQKGARAHFWDRVARKYGVKIHFLTDEKYVFYKPKARMLVLDKVFPQGVLLPKIIVGKPLITLCTLKTHVFTQTTGAIKNYFGMLNTRRHFAHRFIHEAIIDLLQIQKELHPAILAIMDGSVVGFGPGPRAMEWQEADLILASQDEVALDSLAAAIIGLNPKKIKYLTLGKKLKLGKNDPAKIKVQGMKSLPNFHLKSGETFASRGQKLIYHHSPLWLEKLLLQTFLVPWSYLASRLYHDFYWYPFVGKSRIRQYKKTAWGKLFESYRKL